MDRCCIVACLLFIPCFAIADGWSGFPVNSGPWHSIATNEPLRQIADAIGERYQHVGGAWQITNTLFVVWSTNGTTVTTNLTTTNFVARTYTDGDGNARTARVVVTSNDMHALDVALLAVATNYAQTNCAVADSFEPYLNASQLASNTLPTLIPRHTQWTLLRSVDAGNAAVSSLVGRIQYDATNGLTLYEYIEGSTNDAGCGFGLPPSHTLYAEWFNQRWRAVNALVCVPDLYSWTTESGTSQTRTEDDIVRTISQDYYESYGFTTNGVWADALSTVGSNETANTLDTTPATVTLAYWQYNWGIKGPFADNPSYSHQANFANGNASLDYSFTTSFAQFSGTVFHIAGPSQFANANAAWALRTISSGTREFDIIAHQAASDLPWGNQQEDIATRAFATTADVETVTLYNYTNAPYCTAGEPARTSATQYVELQSSGCRALAAAASWGYTNDVDHVEWGPPDAVSAKYVQQGDADPTFYDVPVFATTADTITEQQAYDSGENIVMANLEETAKRTNTFARLVSDFVVAPFVDGVQNAQVSDGAIVADKAVARDETSASIGQWRYQLYAFGQPPSPYLTSTNEYELTYAGGRIGTYTSNQWGVITNVIRLQTNSRAVVIGSTEQPLQSWLPEYGATNQYRQRSIKGFVATNFAAASWFNLTNGFTRY